MVGMELFFYGFTLWLGAYLLTRDSQKITVQLTGWGLIAYAFALTILILFNQFILTILLAPGAFNGRFKNRENIGKTSRELAELWDEDHPEDPVQN